MSSNSHLSTVANSLLGQVTPYCSQYDAELLFAIPRQDKRNELGFGLNNLPFTGLDIWTGFEVSWLNLKGKPIAVIAEFTFMIDAPNLIESKSFKLYLNSFNGTHFGTQQEVKNLMIRDLSAISGRAVDVEIKKIDGAEILVGKLPGISLDNLDIEVSKYQVDNHLLTMVESAKLVKETVNSHLLKSNCLVTGQPDWASVVIRYEGQEINHEGLLKYLISFREHNEFHEQCVERIFTDITKHCQPEKLTVYARYVRRGGLDINPYRTNFEDKFNISRTLRQ